jgi:hypothetical protein
VQTKQSKENISDESAAGEIKCWSVIDFFPCVERRDENIFIHIFSGERRDEKIFILIFSRFQVCIRLGSARTLGLCA